MDEEVAPHAARICRNIEAVAGTRPIADWCYSCLTASEIYFCWLFDTALEQWSDGSASANPFYGKKDRLSEPQHLRLTQLFVLHRLRVFLHSNEANRSFAERASGSLDSFRARVGAVFELQDEDEERDRIASAFTMSSHEGYLALISAMCEQGLAAPAPKHLGVFSFISELLAEANDVFLEELKERIGAFRS